MYIYYIYTYVHDGCAICLTVSSSKRRRCFIISKENNRYKVSSSPLHKKNDDWQLSLKAKAVAKEA